MGRFSDTPLGALVLPEPENLYLKAADLEGVTFTIIGYEASKGSKGWPQYNLTILIDGVQRLVSHGHLKFMAQMEAFQKVWLPLTVTFTRVQDVNTKRTSLILGEPLNEPFKYPHSTETR